jgi:hypothetical protein
MHNQTKPHNIINQMEQDSDDSIENEDEDKDDHNKHNCKNICHDDKCILNCEKVNQSSQNNKISEEILKDKSHDKASNDKLRFTRVFSKHEFSYDAPY